MTCEGHCFAHCAKLRQRYLMPAGRFESTVCQQDKRAALQHAIASGAYRKWAQRVKCFWCQAACYRTYKCLLCEVTVMV